jgi:hypothetical protein
MKKLNEHLLDASKALAYFQDNLQGANALSSALCKYVQFEKGRFYSILPQDVTDAQLYGFKWGGIGGKFRNQVIEILFNKVQNNKQLGCIFDDVNATYTPSYNWSLFSQIGIHYLDEVYYIALGAEVSKVLLEEGLKASDATWHALCVLTTADLIRREDRSITESEIVAFAKGARMIVLGAYDAEGYVCWEKMTVKLE